MKTLPNENYLFQKGKRKSNLSLQYIAPPRNKILFRRTVAELPTGGVVTVGIKVCLLTDRDHPVKINGTGRPRLQSLMSTSRIPRSGYRMADYHPPIERMHMHADFTKQRRI
jgi:hypothetical protein